MYVLPPRPYAFNKLATFLSEDAVKLHYEKHHAAYIKKLNKLTHEQSSPPLLEALLLEASGELRDMAAQVWNHNFFWQNLTPNHEELPPGALATQINKRWGDLTAFKVTFYEIALNHFGSGWVWLVCDKDQLEIISTDNASNPILLRRKALLTVDVWEHSYYYDYQIKKEEYLEEFWNFVNWEIVSARLKV